MFPWAKFRSTKGAVKLHVGLNHQGYLPEFVTITEGNVADITIGRILEFPKDSIIVSRVQVPSATPRAKEIENTS